jgi:hypothetical protein
MTEDMFYQDRAQNATFRGKEGFKQLLQALVAAFSTFQASEPNYIAHAETTLFADSRHASHIIVPVIPNGK